jgi:NTP pyrophosphatase (non-canonical NTP hydrolase)
MTEKTGELFLGEPSCSLSLLFERQRQFQVLVTGLSLPEDDNTWFMYHMNAMQEELGEVLKADKRWKTHRNAHFDPENKLEELADVFITAMNLVIFSGVKPSEFYAAVGTKLADNAAKLVKGIRDDSNY